LLRHQRFSFNPSVDRHILLIDVGATSLQSIRGDSSIQAYLEGKAAAPGRPNFLFPLVAMIAIILAPLFSRIQKQNVFIASQAFGIAAACTFKLSTLCKVCGETGSTEYWLSLTGVVSAAGVGGICLAELSTRVVALATLMCGLIASYQVFAWLMAPSTSCSACLAILILNCLLLGFLGSIPSKTDFAPVLKFKPRYGLIFGTSIGIALAMVGLFDHENGTLSSLGQVDTRPTGSLVGQSLVSVVPRSNVGKVLLVTMSGCHACNDAKAYIATNQFDWVKQVDLDRMSSLNYSIKTVPTLLVLNEKSIVISEISGWSNDPIWIKSFKSVINANQPKQNR